MVSVAAGYVHFAIGTDGTLTTADGQLDGQIGVDHGFYIDPLFQAKLSAGDLAYIDKPDMVYANRSLIKALSHRRPNCRTPMRTTSFRSAATGEQAIAIRN